MARILVTGGRYFNGVDDVHKILSKIHAMTPIDELAQGGATGADELAMLWALSQNIPVATYDADWKTFGNRAGTMRNSRMLREFKPTLAVAFPGNTGTQDMLGKLIGANIPTFIGTYHGGPIGGPANIKWIINGAPNG